MISMSDPSIWAMFRDLIRKGASINEAITISNPEHLAATVLKITVDGYTMRVTRRELRKAAVNEPTRVITGVYLDEARRAYERSLPVVI
jgi:hypothetical protein